MQKLKDGVVPEKGAVLVAEAQTAGRGRRGKQWFSPFGCNLYFSMYWQLEQGIQAAMGLSLSGRACCSKSAATAVAITGAAEVA